MRTHECVFRPSNRKPCSLRMHPLGLIVLMSMSLAANYSKGAGQANTGHTSDDVAPQRVEGFNAIVFAPNSTSAPGHPQIPPDYRGPAPGFWTGAWWVPAEMQKNELVWETASCPQKKRTVFSFVGASAATPPDFAHGPQAKLYVNDHYAVTFDLGIRRDRTWAQGDYRLRYLSKRVQWPFDGYHRQFEMNGDSGLYLLSVPADGVQPGRPVRIKVEIEPFPRWPRTWFMVKDRKDTLRGEDLTDEVAQLRNDVGRLQELVQILATDQYANILGREGFHNQIIYTKGYRHVHQPDVFVLRNGEWVVSFREGSEHIARDGDIVTLRSKDEGRTWHDPRAVANLPDVDERGVGMVDLPGGPLIMGVFANLMYDKDGRYIWQPRYQPGVRLSGTYIVSSKDEGMTWTKPKFLEPLEWSKGKYTDSEGPTSPPILLPNGTLLMPLTAYDYRDTPMSSATVILESKDGQNWNMRSVVAHDLHQKLGGFTEPTIVLTRSGRLICAMRNEGAGQFLWTALSNDEGRTWTKAQPSPMVGHPPELIMLNNGAILCSYGYRPRTHGEPGGIRATLSYDEGATWDVDNEIIIREDLPNFDLGYPISLQRKDGQIVTVYYFNLFDRFYIAQTTWDLPARGAAAMR